MSIKQQIDSYISIQPEPKRNDMLALHLLIEQLLPNSRRWFLDGKNKEGKIITHPNIGYGNYTIKYANGSTRDFYQIGLVANQAGITINIMGIKDKGYLVENFGDKIGKATISGYCIKFKALKDINIEILKQAIQFGIKSTSLN